MDFFTNPFQGLVVIPKKENTGFTVIDDIDHKNFKDYKYVSSYHGFKQRDYNQIPRKLIMASNIKDYELDFLSAAKLKENITGSAHITAFDDRESSSLNETMDSSQQDVVRPAEYNPAESVSSLETFDTQSYSSSEAPSSFIGVENPPRDVFKVPSSRINSSTRDYNNYKVNKSDGSSDAFDNRTLYSDSDTSSSLTSSSVVSGKNKKKYL